MGKSPMEIGVPHEAIGEAISEPHPAEGAKKSVRSTQSLAMPSNGSSPRKIEANRRNAQKSTGPKTTQGKAMSSWNSMRHGLLSKRLPTVYGQGRKQFSQLLSSLQQDLEPVGALEQLLVEKIAQEYWRLAKAAWYEAEALNKDDPFGNYVTGMSMDRILRYQTTINRQLFQAINQLERMQRLRKGDVVPAPLNVQISHDISSDPEEEE